MTNLVKIFADTVRLTPNHALGLLRQRTPGPSSLGSVFNRTYTWTELSKLDWEPYDHPEIRSPATGYRAEIPGKFGLISLDDIRPNKLVDVVDGHATGYASIVAPGIPMREVSFSHLLVGPAEHDWATGITRDATPIVWSIAPGQPVRPSSIKIGDLPAQITVAEAKVHGFEWAKLSPRMAARDLPA